MNTGFARGERNPRRCRPSQTLCLVMRTGWKRASFAFAHRPLAAALGCLNRLLMQADMPLPALRGRLQGKEGGRTLRRTAADGAKSLAGEMGVGRPLTPCAPLMQRALRRCVSRWRICNFFN
ncbi:putative acyl-CoA N-acyltransferase [Klebsiella pneumoniae]|uniref:Putative acyl-CoA N-acyltransferase n=1 Tax=Klebsiella pneumoniae TaxID=573 RepID=A0A2X1SL36_KLEPN|nr:putative acyl-CoA N-acyltransferase [Klebsiella pneumoniae]